VPRYEVRPVTAESWDDFARLFEARGAPHYCWCTPHRFADAHELDDAGKRRRMRELVHRATPIGVLAFADGTPVGWCSIAPRESYVRLARSRTMPRVSPPDTPTWTVLCFFVLRAWRGRGVARALLDGTLAHASGSGAVEVEAYPHDTAGTSSTHRGRSTLFAAAGFRPDEGRRWVWRARRRRA
jgi:GNAT superfamily N-acetyltransferase